MESLSKSLIVLIFAGLVTAFVLYPQTALAGGTVNCQTQYGGGEICQTVQLQVTKTIWDPVSKQFVHNLTIANHHFVAGEEVAFDIKVQNVGDVSLDNVMLTDVLPNYLVLKSGNLTENLGTLTPGQTAERTIKATVVGENQLVSGVVCKVNTATVQSGSESDQDAAQLCVEKPLKVTPSAGPEDWQLILSAPLWLGGLGLFLRKVKILPDRS